MAVVKVSLRFPTKGHKRGDVIAVADDATADALVANGSAVRVKSEPKSEPKSVKD